MVMCSCLFLITLLAVFLHPKGVQCDESISLLPDDQFNFDAINNLTVQPHTLLTSTGPIYFTHIFSHLSCPFTANIVRIEYIVSQAGQTITLIRYRSLSSQNDSQALQVVNKVVLASLNPDEAGISSYSPSLLEVCEQGDMFGVWVHGNVYSVALRNLPDSVSGAALLTYTQDWSSGIVPEVGDIFSYDVQSNQLSPSSVQFLPALRIHLNVSTSRLATTAEPPLLTQRTSITTPVTPSQSTTALRSTISQSTTHSATSGTETSQESSEPATASTISGTRTGNSDSTPKTATEQPSLEPEAPVSAAGLFTVPPSVSPPTTASNSSRGAAPAQSDISGLWGWLLPVIIAAAVTVVVIIILIIVIVFCRRHHKFVRHPDTYKDQSNPPISAPDTAYADLEYTSDYMTITRSNSTPNGSKTAASPEIPKTNGNNNVAYETDLYATVKKPLKFSTDEDPSPILNTSQPATFGTFKNKNTRSMDSADIIMKENDLYEVTDFTSKAANGGASTGNLPLFDEELYTKC